MGEVRNFESSNYKLAGGGVWPVRQAPARSDCASPGRACGVGALHQVRFSMNSQAWRWKPVGGGRHSDGGVDNASKVGGVYTKCFKPKMDRAASADGKLELRFQPPPGPSNNPSNHCERSNSENWHLPVLMRTSVECFLPGRWKRRGVRLTRRVHWRLGQANRALTAGSFLTSIVLWVTSPPVPGFLLLLRRD